MIKDFINDYFLCSPSGQEHMFPVYTTRGTAIWSHGVIISYGDGLVSVQHQAIICIHDDLITVWVNYVSKLGTNFSETECGMRSKFSNDSWL